MIAGWSLSAASGSMFGAIVAGPAPVSALLFAVPLAIAGLALATVPK